VAGDDDLIGRRIPVFRPAPALRHIGHIDRVESELGREAVNIADVPDGGDGPEYWYSSTDQIIVTRNKALLAWPAIAEAAEDIEDRPELPTFTDSHHNLLRILKRR